METTEDRIVGFDIARAFSIIWVVLYHSLDYADLYYEHAAVKTMTYASLAVFTFLSGYLLASRYQFDQKTIVIPFYRKRFWRFYPLFLLSSVILCLMGFNTWFNTFKGLVGLLIQRLCGIVLCSFLCIYLHHFGRKDLFGKK